MAKKSKKSAKKTPGAGDPTPGSEPIAKTSARASAGRTAKDSTSAPRKSTTARPAKTARKKATPRKSLAEPTDDEIRTRAYFISERRHRLDLPGDASSDWIEARRQLLAEARPV